MGQAGPAGGRAAGGREARAQAQRHAMLPLRPCAVAASACSPPAAAWPPAACRSGTCRGMRACTGRSRCNPGGTPVGGGRQGAAGSRQVRQLGPARNLACKLHATPVRAAWQHTHTPMQAAASSPQPPRTWMRYCRPLSAGPPPLMGTAWKPAGALPSSSGVASTGRMAAWGHTKEQMLHCVQLVLSHSGTCGRQGWVGWGGVGSGVNGGDSITRQPVQGRWQHMQAELSNPAASRTHTQPQPQPARRTHPGGDRPLLNVGGAGREDAAGREHTVGRAVGGQAQVSRSGLEAKRSLRVLLSCRRQRTHPAAADQLCPPQHAGWCTDPASHLTGSLSPSMASMGRTTLFRNSAAVREPVVAAMWSAAPTCACRAGEAATQGAVLGGLKLRSRLTIGCKCAEVAGQERQTTPQKPGMATVAGPPQLTSSLPQPAGISMGTRYSSALSTAAGQGVGQARQV